MNKFIGVFVTLIFALAACGGGNAPTTSPASGSTVTAAPSGNTPAAGNSNGTGETSNSVTPDSNVTPNSSVTPDPGESNSNSTDSPVECTLDTASFIADVTVADNTLFQPGQRFTKTWLVKNSGNCPWSELYSLVFVKGDPLDAPDHLPLPETQPGTDVEISVDLRAPSEEGATRARADFEIRNPDSTAIAIDSGTTLWLIIRLDNGEAPKGNNDTTESGPGYAEVSCAFTTDAARVSQLFDALNAYRSQNSISTYMLNERLSEAAQAHAADMACNNLFYHNGSNGSTATSRVAASGYLASYVTENVYGSWPPLTPAEAIQWWANDVADPRHNENLLSTRYLEVGIGYAFFNNFGYYVIDFAVPQ
ncbi:MAG: hypothetical protein HFACDABA_00967 [Anaerolineales bacterium]|nr:hypothetical protein [Anaerolineales bacterium]